MRRLLLTLCCCCGVADFARAQDDALLPIRVDQRYVGKYAGDEWMQTLLDDLPETASRAYRRACQGLGVDPERIDWTQFRLDVRDAVPATGKTWRRYTGAALQTAGYLPPKGPHIIIRIHAEAVRNGFVEDLQQELTHEAVHAVQRATCPEYRGSPKWMREGLALLVAGQGPHRLRQLLAHGRYLYAPNKLLNGLEEPGQRHRFDDYAEDYLGMLYLVQCGGADAVRTLQARMQAGAGWRTGLETAAGRDWPTFRTGALAHARSTLASFQRPDHRAYVRIVSERSAAKRHALVARFVEDHPRSSLAEMVHYYDGATYRDAKQAEPAIAAFKRVLPGKVRYGLEDDARYWIARLRSGQGRHADAARWFREIVRDFPSSSWIAHAAYGWGLALARDDKADDAKRVLAKALRSFPIHKDAAAVAAAREVLGR